MEVRDASPLKSVLLEFYLFPPGTTGEAAVMYGREGTSQEDKQMRVGLRRQDGGPLLQACSLRGAHRRVEEGLRWK